MSNKLLSNHQSPIKPKIAMYWAASCGGCEIALVNIHEHLLALDEHFEFFFCPCLLDRKVADVAALAEGELLITFFNGGIRNSDNEELAHLLRRKSRLLVAFGSCAAEGCIPGLANLYPPESLLNTVYLHNDSLDNPNRCIPRKETKVAGGLVSLPSLHAGVRTLEEVVEVDFTVPGCPPEPHQIWALIAHLMEGKPLPPPGATLGCGESTVCNECTRIKKEKKVSKFVRHHQTIPNETDCLLEQGIVCMGIATRDGCGGLCPRVNMPCTGCYGPAKDAQDQGAKMVAALGSMLDIGSYEGLGDEEIRKRTNEAIASIPDLVGTFYKYSLPGSLLRGRSE